MPKDATSTIAALCYAKPSNLDFTLLVTELGHALRNNPRINCRETREFEDFVIFDLERTRICLAYCIMAREFPDMRAGDGFHSCLIVSVGSTPGNAGEGPLFESRQEVCRGLVERVESRHASDQFLWIEIDEVFTEDIYDLILERIWPQLGMVPVPPEAKVTANTRGPLGFLGMLRNADPRPTARIPEELMPDLEARFDAEMADLQTRVADDNTIAAMARDWEVDDVKRPTHAAMHADKMHLRLNPEPESFKQELEELLRKDPPAPMGATTWDIRDARRIRSALYPPEDENGISTPMRMPLPQRLTIYTINTAVMVVSLPIGAAVMTYCALGRESMPVAARTMALTGAALGVGQMLLGSTLVAALT